MNYSNKSKLLKFLTTNCSNIVLVSNIPETISLQRGQTCKLNALKDAMAVYEKFVVTPPVRKSELPSTSAIHSLRKQAKQLGSKQGEVYNPDILESLAKNNSMSETEIYAPENKEEYVKRVMTIINMNHTAIVFHDIGIQGDSRGFPVKDKGQYEHASAVVGYCNYENVLYFIVCQWGEFYLHKAEDVAESALQIEQRVPETFLKVKPVFMTPQWVEEQATREQLANQWPYKYAVDAVMDSLTRGALEIRQAEPSQNPKILGRLIFDIHPDSATLTNRLIDDYKAALFDLKNYVENEKKHSIHYQKIIHFITELEQESNDFLDPKRQEKSLQNCLCLIQSARDGNLFEHESNPFLRAMRKITLTIAVILSLGIAALLKREYSYQTTGRYTVFADITKTQGKIDKLQSILEEHLPENINCTNRLID